MRPAWLRYLLRRLFGRPKAVTLSALALIAVVLTVIAGCESSSSAPSQAELPFTGLADAKGVAVDVTGDLYVTDYNRVLKLPAGSASQEVLPFSGLTNSNGVAVDAPGNLYVTDSSDDRVLKLPVGSSTQTVLPFTGLNDPVGVAVDAAGNLYLVAFVGDYRGGNGKYCVLKLLAQQHGRNGPVRA
jgi:serine/threonine-protein kinase